MDLLARTRNEIEINFLYLISLKEEDDLNLFFYQKNKIVGMIDLATALGIISKDEAMNNFAKLHRI